ncbi:alpha-glucoside transport system permease protein [Mesorhizobium albiziae]|uniref:Alpha-glucoside transport system permease protein n=1 Tax=Neomesorhizobium albiziae TaxID=335020 RepID=A0A1I3Y8T6_9HYPH|nr:sugar ABC transporter permease [Mesorhizobium albiziae]GLS30013.1 alpha-glucoside ABC transporter permease [Mesorhizobium albiziae]SFK28182.1 alpha-glucoside transport system permease protein [Mesorhizobium albiziae]
MAAQIFSAILVIIVGVGGCVLYFWGANKLVDLIFPSRGVTGAAAVDNLRRQGLIRPWLFIGPALVILVIYLIYPVISTLWYSVYDKTGENFVGLRNYGWALSDEQFHNSIVNNLMWLLVVPAACTFLGLIIAVLTDKIWWGTIAKSLIFLPLAISFVGASVIWKFIYEYRGEGQVQIGILNSIVTWFGGDPQVWISMPFWNNFFLMIILIWIQTGFAMVILSSALRGIPEETIEAAVIDGANPFQIFWKIMIPQIWGTIAVVWTTITILVLKVFDIVLTMTNGQWNSQVLANLMFDWMFRGLDNGRGATIAIIIMLAVLPIMIWNIRQANKEGKL